MLAQAMTEPGLAAGPATPTAPLPPRDMVDLSFALHGGELPRAHRAALASALQRVLPWLVEGSGMAVHRLNVSTGGGSLALLSARTRLTLRLPRDRLADAAALSGAALQVAGHTLHVGAAQPRELLAFGTLYAHFVAARAEAAAAGDELAFLDEVAQETAALGIRGRAICGRHQALENGTLGGYGLMLDGLDREAASRLLECGLGAHRLWGCGVFVPHRSAAAVGQPN